MKIPDLLANDTLNNAAAAERREGRISLTALRCFVAVAEGGGLSRAAERLGLSQPTVSVTLAGLERACGTLLLHRRPRLLLTDAGRDMLVRARLVLSRMQELETSISAFRGLSRGSLTVGFSTPFFAMPMIAAFLRDHPGTRCARAWGTQPSCWSRWPNARSRSR